MPNSKGEKLPRLRIIRAEFFFIQAIRGSVAKLIDLLYKIQQRIIDLIGQRILVISQTCHFISPLLKGKLDYRDLSWITGAVVDQV